MKITTTQKVIKIGSSKGITLPAKELKQLGVLPGDHVKVTVSAAPKAPKSQVPSEYEAFVEQYGETLKNLSQR